MKNKSTVLLPGIVAIFVNVGIITSAIYFGYRYGSSFYDAILSLRKAINLDFFLLNVVCILFCCVMVNKKDFFKKYSVPLLLLTLFMCVLNLFFVSKNILAIFNLIFWFGNAFYLFSLRKSVTSR